MSRPITWQQITAPDFRVAGSLIQGSGDSFQQALQGLEGIAEEQAAQQKYNYDANQANTLAAFETNLLSKSPAEQKAIMDSVQANPDDLAIILGSSDPVTQTAANNFIGQRYDALNQALAANQSEESKQAHELAKQLLVNQGRVDLQKAKNIGSANVASIRGRGTGSNAGGNTTGSTQTITGTTEEPTLTGKQWAKVNQYNTALDTFKNDDGTYKAIPKSLANITGGSGKESWTADLVTRFDPEARDMYNSAITLDQTLANFGIAEAKAMGASGINTKAEFDMFKRSMPQVDWSSGENMVKSLHRIENYVKLFNSENMAKAGNIPVQDYIKQVNTTYSQAPVIAGTATTPPANTFTPLPADMPLDARMQAYKAQIAARRANQQ
ncbi:hypothetical protein [Photobacterium leiognathi]|uniref:hypothetical protein n=1 Tax=Photobacterium leiognathi TaxID=553611 RepID=UPI0029810B8B|nr:hypothetical protein [Photobacterium leiognathi]